MGKRESASTVHDKLATLATQRVLRRIVVHFLPTRPGEPPAEATVGLAVPQTETAEQVSFTVAVEGEVYQVTVDPTQAPDIADALRPGPQAHVLTTLPIPGESVDLGARGYRDKLRVAVESLAKNPHVTVTRQNASVALARVVERYEHAVSAGHPRGQRFGLARLRRRAVPGATRTASSSAEGSRAGAVPSQTNRRAGS